MIKKFKNFDVREYLNSKKVNEEIDLTDVNTVEDDPEFPEEEVIDGTAVYDNPYLLKIANIIKRKLATTNLGEFGIYHDIVYLNDVPGVWFYGLEDDTKNIVCCRDTNGKSISVFNHFEIGNENTAIVTYSTEKLGFKDMIDQLIFDLQDPIPVTEGVVNEAVRYGDGWTVDNVKRFEKLSWDDKDYTYDFIRKFGKGKATSEFFDCIVSNDPDACRIIKTFVNGEPKKDGDGQSRYLMSFADAVVNAATGGRMAGSVQKAVDAGILDNLISEYKGGKPAISTTAGMSYEVSDEEAAAEEKRAARDARRDAILKEDMENYEETLIGLRDTTEAMCNYVKQNGKLDREDKSVMSRRGILLTGKGGIGKTYTLKQVLKEKNMVENRDYVWISSDSTTSDSLYTTMYEYNGKLIIFDDAPKLFDGDYRISMWKNALQTDIEDCKVGYPKGDSKLNVYNIRRLKGDRQRQYFMEIGRKSGEDKSDFYKKEMKKYGLMYSKHKPGGVSSSEGLEEDEIASLMAKIDDAWKEEEDNTQPAMPNQFIFRGVVIIISNDTREKFEMSVGKGGWEAITTRFRNFDISPMAESLWGVIKKKILTEFNDKTIDDDLCAIPRDMTEEFIDEVESLIGDPNYGGINWRTIRAFGDILRGTKGRRTWKKQLRDELSTK